MFLSCIIALLAVFIVWDYFNKKHRNETLARFNITGPKTLPVLGNALALRNVNTENVNDFMKANFKKYGSLYRFWVFNQMHIRIADPKYFELILTNSQMLKKSNFYDFLSDWLGSGLLLSEGRKWFSRRKILTPAFHFKILEQYVEVFDQQSDIMVKKLYGKADGKTAVDMFPVLCLMTLDIITETAMGVKIQAQDNPELEYSKALAYVANIMSQRFVNPTQRTSWLFWLTSPRIYRETQRCIQTMHKFSINVIEQRRESLKDKLQQQHQTTEATNISDQDDFIKERQALLDILLQSTHDGQPLTNEDIREEVDNFMVAGHDTVTSAMSFALYLIARHPDVQNHLVKEIREVLGTSKQSPVSYRDLQNLKYMECAIKESLRLYPSVPAIGREISEDVKLDDITLPAKTNVVLSFSLVMRDAKYFPNPDAFQPERFVGDNEANGPYSNPFLFTPFSAGVRNCLGQRFAMLEMKSTISKILRHFELVPLGPEVQPIINIVLKSKTGAHVGFRPRKLDT